jgi:phosphatidylinositol glycan class O
MRSEIPTVTAIRVKSLMTGALNSYIEVKDNFGGTTVLEDNVFKQLR